jgi:ABC-2 type transport system ATP-binding protein
MWDFLTEINDSGTTIILTTHYLEEAESLCRHVAIIDEGAIIEDAPMSTVLRKLQCEVFVLSVSEPLGQAPELDGFRTALRPDGELEVEMGPSRSVNELFQELDGRDIRVVSLRNKANRLEELFMRLVEGKQDMVTGVAAK